MCAIREYARTFAVWSEEFGRDSDERLAFMRAYYKVKPLMLALPINWVNERAYADAV
jgi:hypothetical protein